MPHASHTTNVPPLSGVRVLEDSHTPQARLAGLLLADLGADVVRVVIHDDSASPCTCCGGNPVHHRGKRRVNVSATEIPGLAESADIYLTDRPPGDLHDHGCSAAAIADRAPGCTHVWMPTYGTTGRWVDQLPPDNFLLAALGGVATHGPSADGSPVATTVDLIAPVHAALGATATVSALVGRARGRHGGAAVVTGLHAVSVLMLTMMVDGLDSEVFNPGSARGPVPSWRGYQCADGEWLFLAALTSPLFIRALDALDRLDILTLPGVDGDPDSIRISPAAATAAGSALEHHFATASRDQWLQTLHEAGVPCAPTGTRQEWRESELVTELGSFTTTEHPVVGRIEMPTIPLTMDGNTWIAGGFDDEAALATLGWDKRGARSAEHRDDLPLDGLRVVDLASYLAGPTATAVLAEMGADVVKVEQETGDPYRAFSIAYLALNQRKRCMSLDLHQSDDHDHFIELLRKSDVLLDNLRPASGAALGLEPQDVARANATITHCSVTAFGTTQAGARLPGFDPIIQSMSGLALAQGGDGPPVVSNISVHDTATGVLSALAITAALYARFSRTGRGSRIESSLAQTTSFAQFDEFTSYAGSPNAVVGGANFVGPFFARSLQRCADGWVAFAAADRRSDAPLAHALGIATPSDAVTADISDRTVDDAIRCATDAGVAACPVLDREREMFDEFLSANDFTQIIDHHIHGRMAVVAGFVRWDSGTPRLAASTEPGTHTAEVLAELGIVERLQT